MKDINIYLIVIMIVIIIKNIFTPVVEGIEEDTLTKKIIGNTKTDKSVPKKDDIDNDMKTVPLIITPSMNLIIGGSKTKD